MLPNAIEMPEGGIVTRLVKGRLEVSNGIVCGDTKADILPIFVVERFGRSGEIGSGFIKGLGIKRGAVAASFAQESNNVVVSGVDPADMLCAVKAVEANGGYGHRNIGAYSEILRCWEQVKGQDGHFHCADIFTYGRSVDSGSWGGA